MGIGAQRINLAVMLASSRVIALAAAPEHDQVLAEPGLVRVVAVREPAAESLAIDQAAALVLIIALAEAPVPVIVLAAVQALVIVLAEALVLIIVPAEAPVPAIVLAAVRALVIVLAGVQEPETALVGAAPERGLVAVPLRIKWVTAVHHRGRVPLLAGVEDLAAVAEIMHAQAATEAAKVWAAAVTAVAAAPE